MGLLECPDELILWILSHLATPSPNARGSHDPGDLAGLRNLSLTHSSLKSLVEPLLYRKLDNRCCCFSRLRTFIRTLLERPELCEHVEEIAVDDVESVVKYHSRGDEMFQPLLDVQHFLLMSRLGVSMGLARRLEAGVRQRDPEADLAILLGLCTNLRRLTLFVKKREEGWGKSLVLQFFYEVQRALDVRQRQSNGEQLESPQPTLVNSFEKLGYIDADLREDGSTPIKPTELSVYYPLMTLPALRTLATNRTVQRDGFVAIAKRNLTPQNLVLKETVIKASGLDETITLLPKLRNLEIYWARNYWVDSRTADDFWNWEYTRVGSVIRKHGTRLDELTLGYPVNGKNWDGGEQLGDLRPLAALRCLTVAEAALFGECAARPLTEVGNGAASPPPGGWVALAETIPTTLESLTLLFCHESDDDEVSYGEDQVERLLTDERFTQLRRVVMERWTGYGWAVTDERSTEKSRAKFQLSLPPPWSCATYGRVHETTILFRLVLSKEGLEEVRERNHFLRDNWEFIVSCDGRRHKPRVDVPWARRAYGSLRVD